MMNIIFFSYFATSVAADSGEIPVKRDLKHRINKYT